MLYRLIFNSFVILLCLFVGCSKAPVIDETDNQIEQTELPPQLKDGNDVYGVFTDSDGKVIPNVVVTDGVSVVTTDQNGLYQFKKDAAAKFVYYSTPAEYGINKDAEGNPSFYTKLDGGNKPMQYDFKLEKLKNREDRFLLYTLADPQVKSTAHIERFTQETLTDLNMALAANSQPFYGLSLGDVVADEIDLIKGMKRHLGSTQMPIFTTIGNHDKFAPGGGIKNNDAFENHFGPSHYSFSRGNVHFVCLDNVEFRNNDDYVLGISQEQIDWLEKDLGYIDKNELLILFTHMPLRNSTFPGKERLMNLLYSFKEAHIMTGHTHYAQNYIHQKNGKAVYEHVHGAICGAWWRSTINGDGTPNGYGIYQVDGNTLSSWQYKSVGYPIDFQLRLHWGNTAFGGSHGYFQYVQGEHVLVANVWNADPDWKVEVFMDGNKLGDMELSDIDRDAWAKGYHIGVLNRAYDSPARHLYTYKVSKPNSTLKVVATDRFGNTYEQSEITSDFSQAIGY